MGTGKWQVLKHLSSLKTITTNSHAVMLPSCSMTMDVRLPLKDYPRLLLPPETQSSHIGPFSSLRHLKPPRSMIFSPTSSRWVEVVVVPLLQLPMKEPQLLRKKRRKKSKMSIWEVFSETMTSTEISRRVYKNQPGSFQRF